MLGQQKHVIITYKTGPLARGAAALTVRWSYDNWTSATDTPLTREHDGSWRATVTVPDSISTLTMAFFNQSGIWDNNTGRNYTLSVAQR
jgi:hypothetical protein